MRSTVYCTLLMVLLAAPATLAQPGRGPSRVNVVPVTSGTLAPSADFTGTVYFKEVAEIATEGSGQVQEVLFEEGQRLKAGARMVRLDAALLEAELKAAQAAQAQAQAQLEQERVRLERAQTLLRDEVTTPQQFDDIRFTVESLGHRAAALKAEVERLRISIAKKVSVAPFDGVVVDRLTELGEWKNSGETIAVFARDTIFDVIVNVPETNIVGMAPGDAVAMSIAGREVTGTVDAVIPRGDVVSRTFPVKIRVEGDWLLEGMTSTVRLPTGSPRDALMVPRDAVLLQAGEPVIFLARENTAVRVPVTVVGYTDTMAGVDAADLVAGAQVVVKGQERLMPGQPLEVLQ